VIRRLLIASLILAGCGGGSPPETSAPPEAPLNSFAATALIVLPTQTIRAGDALGWAAKIGESREASRAFLATIDSSLEAAVKEKGLVAWVLPSELARTARRNPTYTTNPADIRAGDAVRYIERQRDANIPEPVASQLRVLAGFHGARYALVPVEVRFESGSAAGTGRGVLRIAVLDIRGSRLVFIGDIMGPDAAAWTPAVGAGLARRFADLVVP
jgi:hypothetical protein